MRSTRSIPAVCAFVVVLLGAPVQLSAADTILNGTAKSSAGEAMGGVMVSAKPEGGTITTTVLTDQAGRYYFPPLVAGKYRVWAQALSFATAKGEINLGSVKRHDFTLRPMEEFFRLQIGPVVMKDEVEYFKEVGLQQKITVTYALAGQAPDGSRFLLRHEIFRPDGKLSARVTSAGGWLDLAERKLIVPPPALLSAMTSLEKTSDFIVLPSSMKARA